MKLSTRSPRALIAGLLAIALDDAHGQVTERVSVDSTGSDSNSTGGYAAISADGRFVAFLSEADDIVADDRNGSDDVFVRDRQNGTTVRVSVDSTGAEGHDASALSEVVMSEPPAISADGSVVAFASDFIDLVSGDSNGKIDIFVHDRTTGITSRVSVDSSGAEANGSSFRPSISADGRFVAFQSYATNLVAGDLNDLSDVFVHDRSTGETTRISVAPDGTEANGMSRSAAISADGRFVAFESQAGNLISGDANACADVFLRDLASGTTSLVSVDSAGAQASGPSSAPSISADGRFVAFASRADDLDAFDLNGCTDVFVHDFVSGATERVSVDSSGRDADRESDWPSISGDGRTVAFESDATSLVSLDGNGMTDVFVHDRETGATTRVSVDSAGLEGDLWSLRPAISADGRFAAFDSAARALVAGDRNHTFDVFVHGPDLTLRASAASVQVGDLVTLTTGTGKASAAAMLVVVAVDGVSTFVPVYFGAFDPAGRLDVSGTVPFGLSGIELELQCLGIVPSGRIAASNVVALAIE
jgi:Tol biopolymer transport system component